MKKTLLLVVAFATMILGLSSCEKTSNGDISYSKIAWGILHYINGNYLVYSDADQNYYVTNVDEFASNVFPERKNKRVLIGYNELDDIDPSKSYYVPMAAANKNIDLVMFLPFVTAKDGILFSSEMDDEDLTAMGEDPLTVKDVSFGQGYINIGFDVLYDSAANEQHKLTLIYNDNPDDADGKYHLWLMHNAFTDVNGLQKMYTYSTFDLDEVIPDEKTSADIVLHWYDFTSEVDRTVIEWKKEYTYQK